MRFIIPLAVTFALIAFAILPMMNALTFRWFIRDIDIRAQLIATTLRDSIVESLEDSSGIKAQHLFSRVIKDDRLYALGFCDQRQRLVFKTSTFPAEITCGQVSITPPAGRLMESRQTSLHLSFQPIEKSGVLLGQLVLVHDISFVEKRSADIKTYILYLFAILAAVVFFIVVTVAQVSRQSWISGIRALIKGQELPRFFRSRGTREFNPIIKDLRYLIRDLEAERKAKDESQISWSPKALKDILNKELVGDEVLIVSNREPYIHVKKDEKIEIQFPASGVVTALEPIMRACSGTWIAHGGGSADKLVVDQNDHVQVPPENPSYQIRRVWLSAEEEQGYYYGFANEGLWALCHIAHVRPIFRSQDWAQYVAVNEKFARTVVEEADTADPVILVQDYHFALLPKMIRERLPRATVITFWHIPFPNPEVFGICPWRDQLVQGLLGSNILGFHTRFHCNNFIDTVDRYLESRIDRETSTISHQGRLTAVNHYPISIEYPVTGPKMQKTVPECRRFIRDLNHFKSDLKIGVGIDRLDYTKGILERFLAVEKFLEGNPEWVGRFTFIQIAAPSRSAIEQYQHFDAEVRALAAKINHRFGFDSYDPICLKIEHHEPRQVYEYYRASEVCFVSSLHDGMNLVAKEYVAARDDEQGVLILSRFAGASRELPEALIVNPYDIDQCAMALKVALTMSPNEQRNRMRSMRGLIQEYNVYRWAGRMLLDAARLRKRSKLLSKSDHFQLHEKRH